MDDVAVCPDCDSTQINFRTSSNEGRFGDRCNTAAYRCSQCGVLVDEPEYRERKHPGTRKGLAGELEAADPDDVGGSA